MLTQVESLLLHDQVIDSIEFLENKPLLDKVSLRKKYIEEGLSPAQIAHEIDFSKNTVRNALIRLKIPLRERHRNHGNRSVLTYGFRKVKGRSFQNEAEQKITLAIIEFREKEQLSFHKIDNYLDKMGVPTKTNSRQGWSRQTVRSIYGKWSKLKQV